MEDALRLQIFKAELMALEDKYGITVDVAVETTQVNRVNSQGQKVGFETVAYLNYTVGPLPVVAEEKANE